MNKTCQSTRNSNLEILRIIAMIFIIAFHLSRHGFDGIDFILSNPNSYFLYFLGMLGRIGVDIFILISAYFMIKSKFTFRKLLLLGGEVYFYSIMFFVMFILFLTPITPITITDIFKSVLPISHAYWFITDYIALMLISPFLNKLLTKLSKKDYLKLLLLVSIVWIIFPTLTGDNFTYSEMIFFIVLYIIGSFIRLHVDIDKINIKKLFLIFIVSILATFILFTISASINPLNQLAMFNKETSIFKKVYSLPVVTTSISLLLIFLKREEFTNRYINYIAGSVLGVYLIHSNFLVSPWLWNKLIHIQTYFNSPNLIIISISSIFLVYIVSTLFDIIRRLTIEKIWIYIIDNKLNNLPGWFDNKFKIFEEKFNHYLK